MRELRSEVRGHLEADGVEVTLDSLLERDLGFDSLTRVELLARAERAFGKLLPENALQTAERPRDLLSAIEAAQPGKGVDFLGVADRLPSPIVQGGSTSRPAGAATLIDALDWHVREHGDRVQIVLMGEASEERIDYARLCADSLRVAHGLKAAGLAARETVAIMLPTSADYFFSYLGILLAGGIPVPIYPPARPSQIEEHVRRHAGILANAEAGLLITVPEAMTAARLLKVSAPSLHRVVTVETLLAQSDRAGCGGDPALAPKPALPSDVAFIQYTSGSTGNPKGVVLTHANLLANIRAIGEAVRIDASDVFVSWLPLYHDMGLISGWLASLYFGNPFVVMSPLAFLARPERWLQAIHRYRGTLTAAPNFAYELCLKRLTDEQLEGLDLSSVRLMANGAEPVSPETLARFAARLAPYGLRPEALAPVYGLAEATVGLLVPPLGQPPRTDRIDRRVLSSSRRAQPAPPGTLEDRHALVFVCCGRPLPGHEVRVVDATGREVGERVEGRLEFKGPSATGGYYRNPEATRRLFHGDWLDSGDLAYVAEGQVYITGRVKDIVIRGGRNIYPHELELALGSLPGVRKGCVAVFGSPDPRSGTERLVVLAETRETDERARGALVAEMRRVAVDMLGEAPDDIVLAAPHTVLKTSSGKLRRSACRELYARGAIDVRERAVWRQFARLLATMVWLGLRRRSSIAGDVLYAAWVWCLFWLLAPVSWLLAVISPGPESAWTVSRTAARLFLALCGNPLEVRGLENLPSRDCPCILVANHASYVDGILLVAALPRHFGFVAKGELNAQFIAGTFLRRLGVEFVARLAGQQSVVGAQRLADAAKRGRSLAFFPEGTFTREEGLRPFRLGAFSVAVQANLPVVPVAIRGSRAWLRDGQWFPRRGPMVLTIGAPIHPPTDSPTQFAAAIRLRDAAREELLHHCGEPAMAPI
ncbi:MAG TPA: AMP-binding protein [Rhodocyclaceae bacterium]